MSEIKPALTAEEWAEVGLSREHAYNKAPMIDGMVLMVLESKVPQLNRPQAMAALCLHDQPFGFTREDVGGLRIMMQREGPRIHMYGSVATLADRIEALLPPVDDSRA